jgi:hypothetical protein
MSLIALDTRIQRLVTSDSNCISDYWITLLRFIIGVDILCKQLLKVIAYADTTSRCSRRVAAT